MDWLLYEILIPNQEAMVIMVDNKIRLQKYIADAGLHSRRKAEEIN